MGINLEVKGTLAKLLATEDLIVEHKSVETASFNVQTRVLTLPRWERASNNVADLLVAHEVGHALFTPNEDWRDKVSCPQGFVNVTEDVRIESLMKRKFAGLPKTFYRGYGELHDQDFFDIASLDVSAMGIADRVNLYFKVGNFMKIVFNEEEMVVVNQIAAAESFDDALAAAEALYALHQKQKEEQEQEQEQESQESPGGGEGQSQSQENGDEADEDGQESEESEQQPSDESGGDGGGKKGSDEVEEESEEQNESDSPGKGGTSAGSLDDSVKTMDSLNEKLEDLTETTTYDEPAYIEYPKVSPDKIVPVKEIHDYLASSWQKTYDNVASNSSTEAADKWYANNIGCYEEKFRKFKRDIQSEVNYLVKEFECKKSATAYARATTSRTGILDCTKLHTYKYNEDLFKKVTSLPEGKNHGLVFVLDWSGSMCNILEDTVCQLLSLVMFCDKVNIPFKVFAFTNEWAMPERDTYGNFVRENFSQANVLHLPDRFSMLTVLDSTMQRKVLNKHMCNLYTIAKMFEDTLGSYVPERLFLSGTPLNEAIVCLRDILPKFQSDCNVEKAHVIILTDGEAGGSSYTQQESLNGETFIRPRRLAWGYSKNSVYLRNRKTGTVRKLDGVTKTLIEDLRHQFPQSSFTGFRILERSQGYVVRQACGYDEKILSTWKKEKCVALVNQGYNKYYFMSATKLQEDAEFDVDEGATKAKIKNAFARSLKNKKSNKKLLSDFIGEIA